MIHHFLCLSQVGKQRPIPYLIFRIYPAEAFAFPVLWCFAIVAAVASVISIALCSPVTKLCINPIFGIMGAINGVDYNIRPVEVCIIYPAIIIAVAVAGAYFTALYMRSIKASDTADI